MRRRLIFTLFTHTHYDKNEYRDDIRKHFENLLCADCKVRNIVVDNEKTAEEYRPENTYIRSPNSKDNQRYREPAAVAEGIVRPYAVCVVHNIIKSSETGYDAAYAGGNILIPAYTYSGGAWVESAAQP